LRLIDYSKSEVYILFGTDGVPLFEVGEEVFNYSITSGLSTKLFFGEKLEVFFLIYYCLCIWSSDLF